MSLPRFVDFKKLWARATAALLGSSAARGRGGRNPNQREQNENGEQAVNG
jgi:hypothetical protein